MLTLIKNQLPSTLIVNAIRAEIYNKIFECIIVNVKLNKGSFHTTILKCLLKFNNFYIEMLNSHVDEC